MPRMARAVAPEVPHHITARGIRAGEVFNDEADRVRYPNLSRTVVEASVSWCGLMPG